MKGMGINPSQMKKIMKQMNMQEIDATRVIIETEESKIVIENPQVQKMDMMGQETWQIVGKGTEAAAEDEGEDIDEGDITMIMEQTGVDLNIAKDALDSANGDLAQAISDIQTEGTDAFNN
ncbi:nascent polypeptide-associated complex protein [Candidatus Undinarchaeota archaeon]